MRKIKWQFIHKRELFLPLLSLVSELLPKHEDGGFRGISGYVPAFCFFVERHIRAGGKRRRLPGKLKFGKILRMHEFLVEKEIALGIISVTRRMKHPACDIRFPCY